MAGSFVVDAGIWLLENKFVLLGALAALTGASRSLLRRQHQAHARRLQRIEQAAFDVTERELELKLAAKLLQTLHLSVQERRELSGGSLRFSVLVSAARTELARDLFLPSGARPADRDAGVVLELRDDAYGVHSKFELGVGRHSPTVSVPAGNLKGAPRRYVDAHGATEIDGVPIDVLA